MSAEENMDLERRSREMLLNQHNPGAVDELYAPDFLWHEPDRDVRGTGQARRFLVAYLSAFPGMRVSAEELRAEGEEAVTRWAAIPGPTKESWGSLALPPGGRQRSRASPYTASKGAR